MVQIIVIFIISYLIGGVNPAILISKRVLGIDIREMGSGNAGTTNTLRVMGSLWGATVFILDLLKVAIAWGAMYFLNIFMAYDINALKQAFAIGVVLRSLFTSILWI